MRDGRRMSARPKPYTPPTIPDGKVNITDPDSKLVHGMRGWIQGYNAQAACNERHLTQGRRRRRRVLAPGPDERDHRPGHPGAHPARLEPKSEHQAGLDGGAYDFTRSVLRTDRGAALCKKRAQLIEPIFGNTKHNRGFTRFARRGRSAARTEWRLMATTHNLVKLHQHFTAPVD